MRIKKEIHQGLDKRLLVLVIVFVVIGLIAVADASAPLAIREFSDKFYYVKQQLVWAVIGLILLFITSKIHYRYWEKVANIMFVVNLFLLLIILIPGVGTRVYGAKRWIMIGSTSLQPSEFIKMTMAVYLAKVAERQKSLMAFLAPLGLIIFLTMMEPDLGTTIVITGIGIIQLFISGLSLLHLFYIFLSGSFLGLILILASGYRRDRLITFFQQSTDPLGRSYHVRQILLALGSGGLLGVGLGESRQKYLYLPETATDSIFAVIAEEIGFIGSAVILLLFGYLLFKLIKIALHAPDTFSRVFTIGITSWIGLQVFLNIASMVILVPLTGIPLPFFSKGGTALAAMLASIGIILNISKHAEY